MATATREMTFLLAGPERRLLVATASRLPNAVVSDHLTAVGALGALCTGIAYALSAFHISWLWVASLMLIVNWFGDSLDGTLARVRRAERPKYGYYLDHIVDAFSTSAIGIGIGMSPFVELPLALALVVLYLTLSINVYLESHVFGVFQLGYGRIGPTEVRIILILANTLLLATSGVSPHMVWITANTTIALASVVMFATLVGRFGRNLQRLAKLEPGKQLGAG
jgi:phosphatidylglycerophosphate synthase